MLEANRELTYRDVMHIIARTARVPNKEETDGWLINGAGHHLNEKYGFGVLDVSAMVHAAQSWTRNVSPRHKCVIAFTRGHQQARQQLPVVIRQGENASFSLDVDGVEDCSTDRIDQLEHAVVNVSLAYPIRGNVRLTLVSPAGTRSELMSYRRNDRSDAGSE